MTVTTSAEYTIGADFDTLSVRAVVVRTADGAAVAEGTQVCGLCGEFAERLGLPAGIAIASGNIDVHARAAAANAVRPGQLTGILGTSMCWVLPSEEYHGVPGAFDAVGNRSA